VNFIRVLQRWMISSLRRRLMVMSTVFWVGSTAAFAIVLILTGQSRMIREANQRNTALASLIGRDISSRVSSITSDVRAFATHLEQISPDLETQAEALLALRLTSPQRYRAAYHFDDRGNLLFRLDDDPGILPSMSPTAIISRTVGPVDAGVQNAFSAVEGSLHVSEVVFTGMDRSPVMYYSLPLRVSPVDSRVIVFQVDVTDIWQNIDLMTVGRSGIAYLVSPTGDIIAHPDRAFVGRPMPVELAPLLTGKQDYTQYIEPFRKEPVLASFSPVGGLTGWGAVVQQDKSEAYAAVSRNALASVVIWMVLAACGAFGISVTISRFARPIQSLTKTANEIASTGRLTTTGMSQNTDEVGQLSRAFDGMIGRLETAHEELRQAHAGLEKRVEERTTELSEANALLKTEITQREQVEKALRESELKYRHLVQNATTIILEMDTQGRVTFFNQFAEQFFGFKESEIIGKSVLGTIVPLTDSAGQNLEEMICDLVNNPERYRHNENENIRKNGDLVWIIWSNQPLYDEAGRLRRILCAGIDMTEQKKAEVLLDAQAREQAAAAERTRLARDLHDAVSQTLFSASIIADVLPRIWDKNPEQGRVRLEEIRQLTRGALAEMRTLLFELRPAALADAELGELLKQLAESVTGRARLPVSTLLEGQCTLPPDTKIALYRIAQEALNNIAKHSGADSARVELRRSPERVELRVKDNGAGFDVSRASNRSLGLGIMRERARAIGASIDIHSEPGHGTEVIAVWVNAEEEKNNG
jgi:PAS domain S-box-containing protein